MHLIAIRSDVNSIDPAVIICLTLDQRICVSLMHKMLFCRSWFDKPNRNLSLSIERLTQRCEVGVFSYTWAEAHNVRTRVSRHAIMALVSQARQALCHGCNEGLMHSSLPGKQDPSPSAVWYKLYPVGTITQVFNICSSEACVCWTLHLKLHQVTTLCECIAEGITDLQCQLQWLTSNHLLAAAKQLAPTSPYMVAASRIPRWMHTYMWLDRR